MIRADVERVARQKLGSQYEVAETRKVGGVAGRAGAGWAAGQVGRWGASVGRWVRAHVGVRRGAECSATGGTQQSSSVRLRSRGSQEIDACAPAVPLWLKQASLLTCKG